MGRPGLELGLTAVQLWAGAAHAAGMKSEAVRLSCSFDSGTPQVEDGANDWPQNARRQE